MYMWCPFDLDGPVVKFEMPYSNGSPGFDTRIPICRLRGLRAVLKHFSRCCSTERAKELPKFGIWMIMICISKKNITMEPFSSGRTWKNKCQKPIWTLRHRSNVLASLCTLLWKLAEHSRSQRTHNCHFNEFREFEWILGRLYWNRPVPTSAQLSSEHLAKDPGSVRKGLLNLAGGWHRVQYHNIYI